jgi:putative transposase
MYSVARMKMGHRADLDELAQIAGALYSQTVVSFWRTVRKHDTWLKPSSLMRWHSDSRLHAHTADAVVQQFFASLKSWRSRRKDDPLAKPPRRRSKFARLQWKSSAIRLRHGNLYLSNGKISAGLMIPWAFRLPKMVEIGWDGKQYELRAIYSESTEIEAIGDKVAGVDLGEIHLAAVYDGTSSTIVNGRFLRSKRRYQNKVKAALSALLDVKKRGSIRRKKLGRSKGKQLRKIQWQVRDVLHKQTSNLVSTLHRTGVQTVVIGDVRTIRQRTDFGKKANQKIHQWLAGATRFMLTYKSERLGMRVGLQDERYTSQTCPKCGHMCKPSGRVYRCSYKPCGAVFHRDVVGSYNIRAKYQGNYAFPVVGVKPGAIPGMASPTGVRYNAHLRRSALCAAA